MLHLQQSSLLRVTGARQAALLVLTGCLLLAGRPALAQTTPCYEVIPPRAKGEPTAPMLVDKCSGRTWVLVRSGRGVYRWTVVDMDYDKPKTTDRPVTDTQSAKSDGDPKKCFTFNNRKFCE